MKIFIKSKNQLYLEKILSRTYPSDKKIQLREFEVKNFKNKIKVAKRLIVFYKRMQDDFPSNKLEKSGNDIWTGILKKELPELFNAINSDNPELLAYSLQQFSKSNVWFGGLTTALDGYTKNISKKDVGLVYYDKLVCLAEALGVLPKKNPEASKRNYSDNLSPEKIFREIEKKLNINIAPPMGIIHTDGIPVKNDTLLHYRHINSIYAAYKISMHTKKKRASVCEIGGGFGMTAYYSIIFGIKSYNLYDLPIVCLLAANYLINALGENIVSLFGEVQKDNKIKINPYWRILDTRVNQFDLSFNQDSFPEINEKILEQYIAMIAKNTNGLFLSINHEHFYPKTVNNIVSKTNLIKLKQRDLCWIREGFVEEIYTK